MLALTATIADRLRAQPEFAGWDVRTDTEAMDRRALPAIDVRLEGASVPATQTRAMLLQPQWAVALVVPRSATAATELDAAFRAAFGALHWWFAPDAASPKKYRLEIQGVTAPEFADAGCAGTTLHFTTKAEFIGSNADPTAPNNH